MKYTVRLTERAETDLKKLKKSTPLYFEKTIKLLLELEDTPYSGKGHPKPLTGDKSGLYSRHISEKHRLIYEVCEDIKMVKIRAAGTHYDDK
jgi:toxin YoeB